jgi:branched-chain amino acid transport system substrate-binding protein
MRALAHLIAVCLLSCVLVSAPASAQQAYSPGVTDTEIKLGQTMPYSGPASAYGIVGRVQAAYFKMVSEQGGVHRRKVELISLDDGYSPPKTVERVRQLVESDNVLAIFSLLGTPPNLAVAKYLNAKQIPQLLSVTGTPLLDDPKALPWTTILSMPSRTESRILAGYLLETKPDAKVALFYQNDEYGKGYVRYFKEALGEKAKSMIVGEASYESSDPTVDAQIVVLKGSGADTILNASTPKFAGQAIRKIYELGWNLTHLMINSASSIESTLKPAGLEKAIGIITTEYFMMPDDPSWADNKAMIEYKAFMKKRLPNEAANDPIALTGYLLAGVMHGILTKCGDNLSRENLLRQATSFKDAPIPLLVPGVTYTTTAEDHTPFRQAKLYRFDGKLWSGFGNVITVKTDK